MLHPRTKNGSHCLWPRAHGMLPCVWVREAVDGGDAGAGAAGGAAAGGRDQRRAVLATWMSAACNRVLSCVRLSPQTRLSFSLFSSPPLPLSPLSLVYAACALTRAVRLARGRFAQPAHVLAKLVLLRAVRLKLPPHRWPRLATQHIHLSLKRKAELARLRGQTGRARVWPHRRIARTRR